MRVFKLNNQCIMSTKSHNRTIEYSYLIYVYCLLLIFSFSGCKKFLDVKQSTNTNTNPHSVADFEQILNNASLASPNYLIADLMSDDIVLTDNLWSTYSNSFYIKAYQWWPTIWDAAETDPMYNNAYQMILQCNIILSRLPSAPDGTPAQKNLIRAQAKINRAYYYFQLANLYGKGYDAATAAKDLAVPMVLSPDASLLPARSTVQQVYALILQDLQDAVKTVELPDFGTDVIHPGRAAGLALLARVYLFMSNYTQAMSSADAALQIKNTLLDYNNFIHTNGIDPSAGVKNKPLTLQDETNNPESILARISEDFSFYSIFYTTPSISNELRTLYGSTDLRFVYNFVPGTQNTAPTYFVYTDLKSGMVFNYGIGVPEMYLIKAECLARQGDTGAALAQLELIRKARYRPADYVPLATTGSEEVLRRVLEERRKELFLHGGLRLFDLKRLNIDPRFRKDIVRLSTDDGHTIARLEPGSPAYLLPFAPQIITANPSIIQNPR
jgi:tetratricopeptide (TPR) repeat protein